MTTLAAMITSVRGRVSDDTAPYLCSDALFAIYANDAQNEACRRGRLILDSATAAICSISGVATTASYALDARVIFLRRVKWTGSDGIVAMLKPISSRDLDAQFGADWETETGTPSRYVADVTTNTLRPYPIPNVNGTFALTVVRAPLADMRLATTSPVVAAVDPEINARLQAALEHWMVKRFYSMQDPEAFSEKKAAEAEAMFEAEFGKKSSAIDEIWIQREHGFFEDEGVF